MNNFEQIAIEIRKVSGLGTAYEPATITDCDINKGVCTVQLLLSEQEMTEVKLRAVVDGKTDGILFQPAKGSAVIVNKEEKCIVMYSEIDKIIFKKGNSLIEINETLFSTKGMKLHFENGQGSLQSILNDMLVVIQQAALGLAAIDGGATQTMFQSKTFNVKINQLFA